MPITDVVQRDASDDTAATGGDVFARARSGDRDALGVLFRTHHPPLLRYLRGLAVSHAEDVAGQVWIDVARGIGRFSGGDADFRRWLFTIARRRMIDAYRAAGRRPEDPVADVFDEADAGPAHAGGDPQDVVAERLEWAETVLRRLPPTQAEVVLLRVVGGFSVPEVAEMTGRTTGAVRVLAHRGLARVLELLADDPDPVVVREVEGRTDRRGVTNTPAPTMEGV